MLLLILLREQGAGVPGLMLLTLVLALYLTVIELREMRPLHWKWWGWWLSAVFLVHFPAYLALRGFRFYRRRRQSA